MRSAKVDERKVLFVAEVSANHLGDFQRAIEIVKAAALSGANAVKFQTYTADTMTLNLDKFSVSAGHELWGNRRLYDLYEEAHTPWDWHQELFKVSRELGMVPFSSPFDASAVDFLEKLDSQLYKVASLETGDLPLIRRVAETGKPLIISTGATTMQEIEELVEAVRETGNSNLTLLVCTSSYPSDPIDAHLNRMRTLRENFGVNVGVSDHTVGIGVSIAAIALGATVVERHLTLRRSDGGADSAFSLEPEEFTMLVREGTAAHKSLGGSEWSMQNSEMESRRLRRSLYVVKDVQAGDKVTQENMRAIRPGDGAAPKYYEAFLGMRFRDNLMAGTPMSKDLLIESIDE
jgi:N-acetylneuraminate synthase